MHSKLALIAALAALTACRGSEATPGGSGEGAIQVVTVESGDYFFNAPDTISAGMTTFRLVGGGTDFHHIVAVLLEPGRTVAELMRHLETSEHFPSWAREVGGPNVAIPGAPPVEATVDLQPGNYALVCVIPARDGQPHFMKGMIRPLTVLERGTPNAAPPEAGVVMTLSDYDFATTPEISAGTHTIKLENVAGQPHEAVFFQLEPGKSLQDLMGWLEKMDGPPPARPMGGITFIARGEVNYITLDFEPGEYALICFIPDATDNRPHFMHGMMKQFRVN